MARWRDKPAARAAMLALGAGLIAAAVFFALGRDWKAALEPLAHADPWLGVALAAAVVVQLALTGLLFWAVTLSFDATPRVGPVRMIQVIAASSLLNYLPFEAGLVGRAAYLKWRHALPVRQSVQILLAVIALSVAVPGAAVLVALTTHGSMGVAAGVVALLLLCVVTTPIAKALLKRPIRLGWFWAPLRTAELLAGSLRLWLAFQIAGHPMAFHQVLIAASAGFFVSLLSPTPNGLGLREWVIAGLSSILEPTTGPAAALASLVDRAIEALVFTPAGLWAVHQLRREGDASGLQPVSREG
ncbi:MAG: lysylphosphatidylglycerol synthase domain-containing protein [Planctomycetota bacterium]|nr:lysylphosphatidylglycerol synthase domain-containing protein [Planctomycetota bacterium]